MHKNKENIFLIDGTSLCYRAFYAIRELKTSKGVPTNAVYGVISMLKKMINDYSPKKMAIVFDLKGPTKRHEKYEDYKINRKPMPDDLVSQISKIKDVIDAFNIPRCEQLGYEADDIIATLAKKAEDKGWDVVIVSNDKDALQLVNKSIKVVSPNPKEDKVYDEEGVRAKYGVKPPQMIELMALAGDSSDNIEGVKGVGLVTAGKLIDEFGTVDKLYKNIDKVGSESLKTKLIEGEKMARLSRELVTLDADVPLKVDLADLVIGEPDNDALIKTYKELEFGKLLREIMPSKEAEVKYSVIKRNEDFKDIINKIVDKKKASISAAFLPDGSLDGMALSCAEDEIFYVSLDNSGDSELKRKLLNEILENKDIEKIGHDLKEDIILFDKHDLNIKGKLFDVMIADYLLDPSLPKYDLASIVLRRLEYNFGSADSGDGRDAKGQSSLDFTNDFLSKRASEECALNLKLYSLLEGGLKEKHLFKLFENVEMPLIYVLADMEIEGVGVDEKVLNKLSAKMDKDLKEIINKIYDLAQEEFNINSPKQLQEILFGKLSLPASKKTKTGSSTDESVLKKLAKIHDLPKLLLDYRSMNKLKTSYYDSVSGLVDKRDNKIHAKFNQAATSTGRLSSSEPNLQNIPIKTEMGREFRKIFVPTDSGMFMLSADYSQIELRILAHLSGDKELTSAFKKDEDIHKYTASLIFGCDKSDVTGEMRSVAKTVNFGITYGMSPFGLAKDLEISVGEAARFINSYFERYKGVKNFIEKTIDFAKKNGYVTTLLNRRRYIPEVSSKDERISGFAERVAVNTPVQGSAADLIKLAMIECHNALDKIESKMIIQVHDELVFNVPKQRVKEAGLLIKKKMENVIDLEVPLVVDIEAGPNWYEMEKVELKD